MGINNSYMPEWNKRAAYGQGEAKINITVRVPEELRDEIDKLGNNRSEVARYLMELGLQELKRGKDV